LEINDAVVSRQEHNVAALVGHIPSLHRARASIRGARQNQPVVWRWFERPGCEPFYFAGIWRLWTGDRGTKKAPNIGDHRLFSIMTTEQRGMA
jgi:putative SOS response-associated peptidase YedK